MNLASGSGDPPSIRVTHFRPGAVEWAYILLRYGAALLLLLDGFAKLTGAQFTPLDSVLDMRMGHVSGFWLAWYYFSYSRTYGTIIALTQIGGALLLMFRRTTLLGACAALPVVADLALIDWFYLKNFGTPLIDSLLLAVLLALLAWHRKELLELFWRRQSRVLSSAPQSLSWRSTKWAARGLLVLGSAALLYWVANYEIRAPTPIDGAWHVVRVEPLSVDSPIPVTIFFERNRAHLCVFKFGEDDYRWHGFNLNPRSHAIEIWKDLTRKDAIVFIGHYELYIDRLTLTGMLNDRSNATLVLEKMN